MLVDKYPEKVLVDVKARLHLEHTDIRPEDHRVVEVSGTIESYPRTGDYKVVLSPQDNIPFALITSGPCVVLVIVFILDWPTPANSKEQEKREERELEPPQNFLDLSDGEYKASVRLNFEDGYAYKLCEMKKVGENHYQAFVETVHRYPSSKSKDIIRILPHDVTVTDGGPGDLLARTQVRWLREDNSILTGDVEIEVNLKNRYKRINFPEIFSYEYNHSSFQEYPFVLDAKGFMRAVDTPPERVIFDEKTKRYLE
ncbi:hypothetical protein [Myroides indicus]|uniref:Uncharacterized protein n=1 Tax=Myroides indicus TaxID=1323422 RepID=A0A4R7ERV4_9FLAO|nr:hypothetical protein [Myroides indicus]TDS55949.1 hypothetical protein C8P70_12170 [Myroides indicus]